jgi:hypothetical protein
MIVRIWIGHFPWKKSRRLLITWRKTRQQGLMDFPLNFTSIARIIKYGIMDVFDDMFEHRIDLHRINYGIITLIPKSSDVDIVQKFRPICVLQVFFKIVTNPVMSKLLLPCQTAFIKGRYITDGVMLLQEVLRESKFRKNQGVVLKIDFEKTYDKVNWDFFV